MQVKKLAITLFKLTVCLLLTASFSLAHAQSTGKLTGKITDQKTGEALIGASILVEGSTRGAATNVNGEYTINDVPAGTHSVLVRYVGYQNKQISEILIKAAQPTTLNIVLTEAATQQLAAVTVRATARQESANSLYAQQKNSARVTDGISAEAIRRSPDRNTADVLKRVSGVTVQDNKFVVVRGLSDRYNNATLDGAPLPSTEPNRKAFSFDIVPSNMVDNLIINKTATPDLPGDFAGGSVQVTTKDIPDRNYTSVSVGAGYNTASTFKDFKSGQRNTSDYFGFDNGDKKLPSSFPSSEALVNNSLSTSQNTAAIKSLQQDWNVYNKKALPSQNYQLTVGRVKDFEKTGNRFGATVSLSYRNTQNYYQDLFREFYGNKFTDQVYKFSTNVGALANFAYTWGKNKITLKNTYNRIYDDQYLSRAGVNENITSQVRFSAFDLIQKAVFKSTLEGTHSFGEKGSKLTWSASYSNTLNDQPDQRKANYVRDINATGNAPFFAQNTTLGKENARMFTYMSENGYSGNLNYSTPLKMFNNSATFKAGLNSSYRDRGFTVRFIGLLPNNVDDLEQIRQRPLNTLYGQDLIDRGDVYRLSEIPGSYLDESYNGHAMTNAGYAMLDNKLSDKLRVVWGVRVEHFDLDLQNLRKSALSRAQLSNVDVLPSANFTYSLTPKANLRLAYYRTLARPEFRELAPFGYYDYEQVSFITGNPNLKRTLIDNFDLRYEFFPSAGQIISVSGFYKNFQNAIEAYNFDQGSNRQIEYRNSPKVTVYGAEFELRHSLGFISNTDFLKNTTLYTNVSLIKSKATNPDLGVNLNYSERPLVGQAPYVVNAGLMHTFLENKVTFNALYNVVGRRLNVVGGPIFPAIWEAPRNVIDLQLGIKVLKSRGELKLNANDILNQRSLFYFDRDGNKKYDQAADQTLSRFKYGSNYSFVFSYNF
ncbi:TonB-dependent receptor [Mucilaginibacter aquatilis]|uniref:Outer membrane beta-barrel protein n=1 Tax=Mucilaginibacter aquatilis TaxID=1517760 RepID=A0A6I4I4L0_9SPHI|nr:TonB-dependent receptor [Mucilaginibacter aquatilis]MVN90095.1 outer membrane beta-barrel protein [Mucilaginibacter aquatilis]